MRRLDRLAALETESPRMIIAKLPPSGDLPALLTANGIVARPDDLVVVITRPEGCGSDFARIGGVHG